MKLIEQTIKYRMKWLTKYINKHDRHGGAETAKVKRTELYHLLYKVRKNY